MTAPVPAVMFDSVRFGYETGSTPVLDGINLDIPARHICAILGPNGSGKTTMLHTILGLLHPNTGDMHLLGHQMWAKSHVRLKRIVALVPQKESVPFDINLMEYVLLGRAPHLGVFQRPSKRDRRIAWDALDTVGMQHMADRTVPSLSGGESQLAMVARALTQQTEILLMDEPTSHLDLANTKVILQIMQRLVKQGKTVIYTTNDPNAAGAAADHVVMIRNGHVACAGEMKVVFTSENLTHVYGVDVEVFWKNSTPYIMIPSNNF